MLIIGGVAVPLVSLPAWAQHVSAFFPGRYAVEALQACVTGGGLRAIGFDLLALAAIGGAAFLTGAKLFRWDTGQRFRAVRGKAWLLVALAAWAAVGAGAEVRNKVEPANTMAAASAPAPAARQLQPWERVTEQDIAAIDVKQIPPDDGLVTPMARPDDAPNETVDMNLALLEGKLPHWAPGHVEDPAQRARNLLCVAALPDLIQNPIERWVPAVVLGNLKASLSEKDLVRVLTWIALHPQEGKVPTDLAELGIEGVGPEGPVRERMQWYAMKFVAILTGRWPIENKQPVSP
jgi:hypothetical protein